MIVSGPSNTETPASDRDLLRTRTQQPGAHVEVPTTWLDPAAAASRLRAAGLPVAEVVPRYVRHKPDLSTIVGYDLEPLRDAPETGPSAPQLGYVRWCSDPALAAEIADKVLVTMSGTGAADTLATGGHPPLPPALRLDDHTVFVAFPHDAQLRRVRWYSTPDKLKRTFDPNRNAHRNSGPVSSSPVSSGPVSSSPAATVPAATATVGLDVNLGQDLDLGLGRISARRSSARVLAYKPERRVVVGAHLVGQHGNRRLVIRVAAKPIAERLWTTATHLGAHGVSVPTPVAAFDDGRVYVDEFVDGVELRAAIAAGDADADAVADAIARFHAAPPRNDAAERTLADVAADAAAALDGLVAWSPPFAALVDQLSARLAATIPTDGTPTTIHGDLHDKNVLTDTQRYVFIDLERTGTGTTETDLGQLRGVAIAHQHRGSAAGANGAAVDVIEAAIDAYASRRYVNPARLAWCTGVALIDQAVLAARQLLPGWEHITPALLDAADSHLSLSTAVRPR